MNIDKITINHEYEANGKFTNDFWVAYIRFTDKPIEIISAYTLEQLFEKIREFINEQSK